jgi:hypothetical protein
MERGAQASPLPDADRGGGGFDEELARAFANGLTMETPKVKFTGLTQNLQVDPAV